MFIKRFLDYFITAGKRANSGSGGKPRPSYAPKSSPAPKISLRGPRQPLPLPADPQNPQTKINSANPLKNKNAPFWCPLFSGVGPGRGILQFCPIFRDFPCWVVACGKWSWSRGLKISRTRNPEKEGFGAEKPIFHRARQGHSESEIPIIIQGITGRMGILGFGDSELLVLGWWETGFFHPETLLSRFWGFWGLCRAEGLKARLGGVWPHLPTKYGWPCLYQIELVVPWPSAFVKLYHRSPNVTWK